MFLSKETRVASYLKVDGKRWPLKLIIAIVQPSRLEAVKTALSEVEVFRLTVLDCQGFGRQKGQASGYRGPISP